MKTRQKAAHELTNHLSGCEKMSVCGDAAEQGHEVIFRAYDNKQRAGATVTAIVHVGQDRILLEGVIVEPFLYELRFSTVHLGMITVEVFFGEEQIPESPVRVEIVPRNCRADFPGSNMVPVSFFVIPMLGLS